MNNVLTTTDRLIGKLGPLNRLLNGIVERVVPHKIAQACDCPFVCYSSNISCGGGCYRIRSGCGNLARDCFGGTTWTCTSGCFC